MPGRLRRHGGVFGDGLLVDVWVKVGVGVRLEVIVGEAVGVWVGVHAAVAALLIVVVASGRVFAGSTLPAKSSAWL